MQFIPSKGSNLAASSSNTCKLDTKQSLLTEGEEVDKSTASKLFVPSITGLIYLELILYAGAHGIRLFAATSNKEDMASSLI